MAVEHGRRTQQSFFDYILQTHLLGRGLRQIGDICVIGFKESGVLPAKRQWSHCRTQNLGDSGFMFF